MSIDETMYRLDLKSDRKTGEYKTKYESIEKDNNIFFENFIKMEPWLRIILASSK